MIALVTFYFSLIVQFFLESILTIFAFTTILTVVPQGLRKPNILIRALSNETDIKKIMFHFFFVVVGVGTKDNQVRESKRKKRERDK